MPFNFGVEDKDTSDVINAGGFIIPYCNAGAAEVFSPRYALNNGITDVYTVPTGKKLILYGVLRINPTAGAITFSVAVRRSGADYRCFNANNSSVAAITSSGFTNILPIVLEAGETIRITTNAAGAYAIPNGLLIPATANIFTRWVDNIDTTERTLYQVPTGKVAHLVLFCTMASTVGGAAPNQAGLVVLNNGGGSPTVTGKLIPNGEVSGNEHRIGTASPTDNTTTGFNLGTLPVFMTAGDKITVQSSISTPGTHTRVTVIEVDA